MTSIARLETGGTARIFAYIRTQCGTGLCSLRASCVGMRRSAECTHVNRSWRSVRRRHTPYQTPATTPCAPLIAMTRSCARGTPPSSRLSPLCAPREPLQRRCSARRAAVAKLTIITRITSSSAYSYLFLDFHGRFAVLSTEFPRTFHRRSKNRYSLRNTYALRGVFIKTNRHPEFQQV